MIELTLESGDMIHVEPDAIGALVQRRDVSTVFIHGTRLDVLERVDVIKKMVEDHEGGVKMVHTSATEPTKAAAKPKRRGGWPSNTITKGRKT